ncbi:cullin-1-like [Gastrolobium bilobum]|uniref:cullin-1-like n=1 Tax=Gastrolobium bilobum TaxID=150636 RepID=UPI002AB01F01|nr:cullin-1-like [Gastrolobium bilobum]
MNDRRHMCLMLSMYILSLSFKTFPADSEPMNSNTECKKSSKSFEEGWPLLQTAVDRIINQVEGVDNSSFTSQEYMSYYTTVYELCTDQQHLKNSKKLYDQYKKIFEEYINSTVLPSLRGKKDENLLRELLRRWSNHKIMTRWLSRFFNYLNRYDIPRWELPSLLETSFLSFYDLVYGEMNKQVVDAILYMIDQERAGEQINRTLINNTLAIYSEIGDSTRIINAKHFAERMIIENVAFYYDGASTWIASSSFKYNKPKEEKLHDSPIASSKKINLISSNGDVFEIDYSVALMSKTIKDAIKSYSSSDIDSIHFSIVSSRILAMVIEYCNKHTKASNSNYKEDTSDVDLKEWDTEFVKVHQQTLFDLIVSANYLNIKSLLDLTTNEVAQMIRGKTPDEIRKFFNIKDDFIQPEEDEFREH